MARVEAVMLEIAPEVPVRGALCFVDADLPLVGTLTFDGFPLLYARRLARRLNARGPVAGERVLAVAGDLAQRLPPA